MAVTYGETLLAKAEEARRSVAARRRRRGLLYPTVIAICWALADLVAARNDRLVADGAGLLAQIVDHTAPIAWTVAFVLFPMIMALKPDPLPAGGLLALLAGPALSPALFGPGGWKWWQILVVTAAATMVLSAAILRARGARARA